MSDIYDIYSGSHIEQNEYEIDHFVPWSFVTNDEMWNLIPVNPSLNASKEINFLTGIDIFLVLLKINSG